MSGPAGSLPALQIHPTRRCNLKCLHCYSESGPSVREALDVELVLGVIRDAAELGFKVLAVSGGEPLMYAPLPRLLRAAHVHDREAHETHSQHREKVTVKHGSCSVVPR